MFSNSPFTSPFNSSAVAVRYQRQQKPSGYLVGFWRGSETDLDLPMPKGNSATCDQTDLINKLRMLMKADQNPTQFKGSSRCRLCGVHNGSQEHKFGSFIVPSGYIHYLEAHNVAIDPVFGSFLRGSGAPTMEDEDSS